MPHLDGVDHRWIEVDGVRIHVAEAGVGHPGPPIVLIHGWPQHWWCWHRVIPLLAERHHVVALDSRGAGWSDAPAPGGDAYDKRVIADELAAVIGELGLDRPLVVGHDWGAWLSILIGGRHPDLTRGVVATAMDKPAGPDPRLHRIYNIGSQRPIELTTYVSLIEACVGRKAIINSLPMQPGDVADTFASVDRLSNDINYRPMTSVEDGVRNFVSWYRTFYAE